MKKKLIPLKTKFKKHQKGKSIQKIYIYKQNILRFGSLGLRTLESFRLTSKTLIAIRRYIRKYTKKKARFFIRYYSNVIVTKKPLETRMGKGKGNFDHWAIKLRAGCVFIEMGFKKINRMNVIKVLNKVKCRLPFKTILVKKKVKIIKII
jgi:large subunit ribosomal protein L16